MIKYFEYKDPDMAAHVKSMVAVAREAEEYESPIPEKDLTIYENNNRDKPFLPMTVDDMTERMNRGEGLGRDHFVVAKHREEQKKFIEEYNRMEDERDSSGNFTISHGQIAKVAQVVKNGFDQEKKNMSYFERIKESISLSKKAKEKRKEKKMIDETIEKAINTRK